MGRKLSAVAAIAGVILMAVASWKLLDRRGPGGLYENAPGTRATTIRVGPTIFHLASVSRAGRDGRWRSEDGLGRLIDDGTGGREGSASAAWLDEARALVAADEPFDIIEARVFDSATKALADGGAGWTFQGSRIVLRRAGGTLPGAVDLWLRVLHSRRGDSVARLEAAPGSSAALGGGSASIRELRKGAWGYRTAGAAGGAVTLEWTGPGEDPGGAATVALDWTPGPGGSTREDLGLVAIAKDGRRIVPDFPHFLRFGPGERLQVLAVPLPLESLDALELRPFRGRDAFYFEDVLLPRVGPVTGRPPAAEIRVDGKETEGFARGLEPLGLRVRVLPGIRAKGIVGKQDRGVIEVLPPDPGDGRRTTVIFELAGLSPPRLDLEVLGLLGSPVPSGGSSSSTASSPGRYTAGYRIIDAPLERIGALRFTIPVVAENPAGR